jgi:hypothetical protein
MGRLGQGARRGGRGEGAADHDAFGVIGAQAFIGPLCQSDLRIDDLFDDRLVACLVGESGCWQHHHQQAGKDIERTEFLNVHGVTFLWLFEWIAYFPEVIRCKNFMVVCLDTHDYRYDCSGGFKFAYCA